MAEEQVLVLPIRSSSLQAIENGKGEEKHGWSCLDHCTEVNSAWDFEAPETLKHGEKYDLPNMLRKLSSLDSADF